MEFWVNPERLLTLGMNGNLKKKEKKEIVCIESEIENHIFVDINTIKGIYSLVSCKYIF